MRVSPPHRLLTQLFAAVLLAAAPVIAVPVHGQTGAPGPASGRALVLQTGHWYADVDGIVGALRAELPLGRSGRWLLVPGVSYAHYTLGTPVPEIDLLSPELLVHLQLGQGRVRPYVGGGGGLVLINMFHTVDPVLSLLAGVRADLTARWGARVEADTRAFGQFNAGALGWSVGLSRRF